MKISVRSSSFELSQLGHNFCKNAHILPQLITDLTVQQLSFAISGINNLKAGDELIGYQVGSSTEKAVRLIALVTRVFQ